MRTIWHWISLAAVALGWSPMLLSASAFLLSSCRARSLPFSDVTTAYPTTPRDKRANTRTDPVGALRLSSSSTASTSATNTQHDDTNDEVDKNALYVQGLLDNLTAALDKYILTGSAASHTQAHNIYKLIQAHAVDDVWAEQARRRMQRAGLPAASELGKTDAPERSLEADRRRRWEAQRQAHEPRSALSQRASRRQNQPNFTDQVDCGLDSIERMAQGRVELKRALQPTTKGPQFSKRPRTKGRRRYMEGDEYNVVPPKQEEIEGVQTEVFDNDDRAASHATPADAVANRVAQLVAQAGASSAFEGESLGIGGLDHVLSQVKRRVWTPLAAPPQLLKELGVTPVRGLLLYGQPGNGKTLLARKLGEILSPLRPVTVVSGPEIMDKFVGSSEQNLRALFDHPPALYDSYRQLEPQPPENDNENGLLSQAALHVIVLDEFDAIARTRGGRSGSGDSQGDAGVARDSVVNQLLAKLDGVEPLCVPTLVIGLTNKRSLIDPALLRPGRLEVQVEVPPPKTVEQRVSILKVHTAAMHTAGRLFLRNAPIDSAAHRKQQQDDAATRDLPSYDELLHQLAVACDGFSGAALAGVTRAAASHALERAVDEFMALEHDEQVLHHHAATDLDSPTASSILNDCVVLPEDFQEAVQDVRAGMGDSDWTVEEEQVQEDETEDSTLEDVAAGEENEEERDDEEEVDQEEEDEEAIADQEEESTAATFNPPRNWKSIQEWVVQAQLDHHPAAPDGTESNNEDGETASINNTPRNWRKIQDWVVEEQLVHNPEKAKQEEVTTKETSGVVAQEQLDADLAEPDTKVSDEKETDSGIEVAVGASRPQSIAAKKNDQSNRFGSGDREENDADTTNKNRADNTPKPRSIAHVKPQFWSFGRQRGG